MRVRLGRAAAVMVLVSHTGPAAQQPAAPAGPAGYARDAACAPLALEHGGRPRLTVLGGAVERRLEFAVGERIVVSGGSLEGVRAGDEYAVRRRILDRTADRREGPHARSLHTAGLVQIVEVLPASSVAVITLSCDGIGEGDHLEPFVPPPAASPRHPDGTPDYGDTARIVIAGERRRMAARGDFVVVDRGSSGGLRAGQAVTIFRRPGGPERPPAAVGVAVVHEVRPETAVVQIASSVDAVYVGDLVALHR